jgi:hypothetical protein
VIGRGWQGTLRGDVIEGTLKGIHKLGQTN